MTGRLIYLLCKIWTTNLRYRWSRLRHINSPLTTAVRHDLLPVDLNEVMRTAQQLYNHFIYTRDGLNRLYDSIDTPAGCWERAFNPGPLKDDCDGFHSALYWAAHKRFDCYLMTLVAKNIRRSHTLLYLHHNNLHYGIDYVNLIGPLGNIEDLISEVKNRRSMTEVILVELSKWTGKTWAHHYTPLLLLRRHEQ